MSALRESGTLADILGRARLASQAAAAPSQSRDRDTQPDMHQLVQCLRFVAWAYHVVTAIPAGTDQAETRDANWILIHLAINPDLIPESTLREQAKHAHGANPESDHFAFDAQGELAVRLLAHAETDLFSADLGIAMLADVIAMAPDDYRGQARMLSNLGLAHQIRFSHSRDENDLKNAAEFGELSLRVSPTDTATRIFALISAKGTLELRYELNSQRDDLDRVIELGQEVVDTMGDGDTDRTSHLINLARYHFMRCLVTGSTEDANQAVSLSEGAIPGAADNDSLTAALTNLCSSLTIRFERAGKSTDLQQAIEAGRKAIELARDADRVAPMASLATAYCAKFEHLGRQQDLDRAVQLGEESLTLPCANQDQASHRMVALGNAYHARFNHTGDSAFLDLAIQLFKQAADALPDDRVQTPVCLSNLGNAYRARYEHFGSPNDLDAAIAVGEGALALASKAVLDRAALLAALLTNLSIAYGGRFDRDGASKDLERAIEVGEQAAKTGSDKYNQSLVLSNLGDQYRIRYLRTKRVDDLDRAAAACEEAVAISASDHPGRARYLFNLGRVTRLRLDNGLTQVDGQAVLRLAHQVHQATTSPPLDRIRASIVVGDLASLAGDKLVRLRLLDDAIGLLPSLPPREAGWADQERQLGGMSGLVSNAVAAHCAIGDAAGAARAAEHGRAVLLTRQLDLRTDLSDLHDTQPRLAARFHHLRERLNLATTGKYEGTVGARNQHERHRQLWAKYDAVLTQIRATPGFEGFLQPPQLADLMQAASGGMIVQVSVGDDSGNAVIITADADPRLVPLPHLRSADVARHVAQLLAATQNRSLTNQLRLPRILTTMLAWLWDCVAAPIVEAAPISGTTSRPRVWWMPLGLLGLLPLHAAEPPGAPGALDAVISSYTPTLRLLARTRDRLPATDRKQLIVALEHTPDLPDLPHTAAEATLLHQRHPGIPPLRDRDATTERVRAALPSATWAHFACHASAAMASPSRNVLHLADSVLALPDISSMRLDEAELAYLSACQTSATGWRHADEALHLASAFQLAGFRHVIGSLWQLRDDVAAEAADMFYSCISTPDSAANALDQVTRALRDRYRDRPQLWAPFVHSGP
ncbi:CHAT domain-containing protein [Amycolatopsis tolypomycina]|uniref:CHAT domain-containing protein n=1 Tax=Amycolatopsis tolypomycina TaxID=208445 RepID=UPI00339E8C82